jgi:hypothetical protein
VEWDGGREYDGPDDLEQRIAAAEQALAWEEWVEQARGQLQAIEQHLGRPLEDDEVEELVEAAERAEPDHPAPIVSAFVELNTPEEDGHENYVEGQTQLLQEGSGKTLSAEEADELAAEARLLLDEDGDPDVQRAWQERHGKLPDPESNWGRVQRLANAIESERKQEAEIEEAIGGDLDQDSDGLRSIPNFETQRERHEFLARQIEEASADEAAERVADRAAFEERFRGTDAA